MVRIVPWLNAAWHYVTLLNPERKHINPCKNRVSHRLTRISRVTTDRTLQTSFCTPTAKNVREQCFSELKFGSKSYGPWAFFLFLCSVNWYEMNRVLLATRAPRMSSIQKRFGHGHGDGPVVPILPYRCAPPCVACLHCSKPITPPNRCLAYIVGAGFIALGAFMMTGAFWISPIPEKIPAHEFDRHPNKNLSKVIS